MRTTVVLDDQLFKWAKERAASLGTSLSELINQALRDTLQRTPPAAAAPTFRMPTCGAGEPRVRHEAADLDAVLADDDVAG